MPSGGSDPDAGGSTAAGEPDADAGPVVLDPDAVADGTDPLGVGAGDAPPGTYALVVGVDSEATITVGALGPATFPAGGYAYVGSAFGSNGLGRVDRHRRVAAGDHDVTHWHVDYLGGHPAASLDAIVAAPHADIECEVAAVLRRRLAGTGGTPVPAGFGASDCDCPAHLVGGADTEAVRTAAAGAVREAVAARPDP